MAAANIVAAAPTSIGHISKPVAEYFREIPEMSFSHLKALADIDRTRTDVVRCVAVSGSAYGSIAGPIHGNRLIFRVDRPGTGAIDISNSYFLIGVQFSNDGGALPADYAPDPFSLGTAFSEFRCYANDSNNEIYRTTAQDLSPTWTAQILLNYTEKNLKQHSSLFLPFDLITDELQNDQAGEANTAGADKRHTSYCSVGPEKIHYKPLFLQDIMPRIQKASYVNINKLSFEIRINPTPSFLFQYRAGQAASRTSIVFCEFFAAINTPQALPEHPIEYLGQIYPQLYRINIRPGTYETIIPNIQNALGFVMFRPTNLNFGDEAMRVTTIDGEVTSNYNSLSNFVLFDLGGTKTGRLTRADELATLAEGGGIVPDWTYPLQGFSCRIGDYEHPSNLIRLENDENQPGFSPTLENLYLFYSQMCARFGTGHAPALNKETFARKMPMIAINFYDKQDFAPRTGASNLILRFKGVAAEQNIYLITYSLRAIALDSAGGVSPNF